VNAELGTDGTRKNRSVPETPVVTAVTRISAPVEDVWRVIVAFDQYSQWHPVLSLDAKPEQVVIGAEIPGHISGGDTGELDVTMRIVDAQAPRRLVWEGGSLDAILGRHSFVLTPQPDGTTELTDSEEFFGVAVADLVPTLGQTTPDERAPRRPRTDRARSRPRLLHQLGHADRRLRPDATYREQLEQARAQLGEEYARNGAALRTRVEGSPQTRSTR
jgi:hypothetical protein